MTVKLSAATPAASKGAARFSGLIHRCVTAYCQTSTKNREFSSGRRMRRSLLDCPGIVSPEHPPPDHDLAGHDQAVDQKAKQAQHNESGQDICCLRKRSSLHDVPTDAGPGAHELP